MKEKGRNYKGRVPGGRPRTQGYILTYSKLSKRVVLVAVDFQLKGTLFLHPQYPAREFVSCCNSSSFPWSAVIGGNYSVKSGPAQRANGHHTSRPAVAACDWSNAGQGVASPGCYCLVDLFSCHIVYLSVGRTDWMKEALVQNIMLQFAVVQV